MMRKRLFALLPLALIAHVPLAGAAAPLHFQCDATMEIGGEHTRRLLTLDLAHGSVEDGKMHWRDGAPSPVLFTDRLVAFVRRDGQLVEWGAHDTKTGEAINRFSLDLATGAYMFSGPDGIFARGRCRALPDSV